MNEMTTLASVGELPALPMGMSYPRRKGWLLGPVRKSKRLKFRKLESRKMKVYLFEAVDPTARAGRIKSLATYAARKRKQASRFSSRFVAGSKKLSSDRKASLIHLTNLASLKAAKASSIVKSRSETPTSPLAKVVRRIKSGNKNSAMRAAYNKLAGYAKLRKSFK